MDITIGKINKLYIACRELFKEHYSDLRQTNDDEQYLIDALKCEICANTVSLCIELFYELTDSPAIETSCRSILEALILLRMVYAKELDQEQIANFKHQSALLFYGNIFETAPEEQDRFFTDEESNAMQKKIAWIVEDYDRAFEAYRTKYGDKMDERVSRAAIREGLFFTNKNPRKRKKFNDLFKKHLDDVDGTGTMYQRISFFAHPWYVDTLEDFETINAYRQKDVMRCFQLVQRIFREEMELAREEPNPIDHDVVAGGEYFFSSQSIEGICSTLCINTPVSSQGSISYEKLCFAFLRDTLTEMNILMGLGYYEIALSKYQSVCEFLAMNDLIGDNPEMYKAFDYSTRVQLGNLRGDTPFFANLPIKEPESLRSLFDRAPYHSDLSFEEYCQSMSEKGEKSSLAFSAIFLPKRILSFIDLVRSGARARDKGVPAANKAMLAYLFSIDVHHATGFCYTEPRDCWKLLTHLALQGVYEALYEYLKTLGLSPEKRVPLYLAIIALVAAEREEIKALSLKYPEWEV